MISSESTKLKEKLSSILPNEKKKIFSDYASGKTPAEWETYFKAMRETENELINKYSYLPDNKAVSLARGVIWNFFVEK